jgi:hypothetical protein
MYLVICNSYDKPAFWAYEGLKTRGINPIELVDADSLVCSSYFDHQISVDQVTTKIVLPDGRQINSGLTRGVLNRLQSIPTSYFKASKADNLYAFQELSAFFISWLYSLPCLVLNPATPQGFSGEIRHISNWILLAKEAGLSVPKYEENSIDAEKVPFHWIGRLVPPQTKVKTVFVVESQIVGVDVPSDVSEGCMRLAELAQTPLLGVEFSDIPNEWIFIGATPCPNLLLGGDALLDALAQTLQSKREGHR